MSGDETMVEQRLERAVAAACGIQRWRDWTAHVTAYVLFNIVFIAAWAFNGKGYFWPAWTILGWGVGISFQHFYAVVRRPITAQDALRKVTVSAG